MRPSRILVVDDDRELLEAIRRLLEADGHDVETAVDGAEALKCALGEPPDLIVLDVGIPRINGWEVCEIVRRQSHTQNVPILFLTGRGEMLDRITALQVGGTDHQAKPFQADALRAKIRALIGREAQARVSRA